MKWDILVIAFWVCYWSLIPVYGLLPVVESTDRSESGFLWYALSHGHLFLIGNVGFVFSFTILRPKLMIAKTVAYSGFVAINIVFILMLSKLTG
jgi:hypothetical protein